MQYVIGIVLGWFIHIHYGEQITTVLTQLSDTSSSNEEPCDTFTIKELFTYQEE